MFGQNNNERRKRKVKFDDAEFKKWESNLFDATTKIPPETKATLSRQERVVATELHARYVTDPNAQLATIEVGRRLKAVDPEPIEPTAAIDFIAKITSNTVIGKAVTVYDGESFYTFADRDGKPQITIQNGLEPYRTDETRIVIEQDSGEWKVASSTKTQGDCDNNRRFSSGYTGSASPLEIETSLKQVTRLVGKLIKSDK